MTNQSSFLSEISFIAKSALDKITSIFDKRHNYSLKETLEEVIEEQTATGSQFAVGEKIILQNIADFTEMIVSDVMIPKTDIIYVNQSVTIEELRILISEKPHTRIPVVRESLDDVMGFIHIKDLVASMFNSGKFELKTIIREMLFVPPSMKISNLLVKMRVLRTHIAMIVDEYGGTAGLVTLEDLVEQIVGNIEDEHDEEEIYFRQLSPNIYESSARISIEDLQERVAQEIGGVNGEDYDTLGGLIYTIAGRIPISGEIIKHPDNNLEFEITEADSRRVKRIKIHIISTE